MLDWLINTNNILGTIVVWTMVLIPFMLIMLRLLMAAADRLSHRAFERETKRAIRRQVARGLARTPHPQLAAGDDGLDKDNSAQA